MMVLSKRQITYYIKTRWWWMLTATLTKDLKTKRDNSQPENDVCINKTRNSWKCWALQSKRFVWPKCRLHWLPWCISVSSSCPSPLAATRQDLSFHNYAGYWTGHRDALEDYGNYRIKNPCRILHIVHNHCRFYELYLIEGKRRCISRHWLEILCS